MRKFIPLAPLLACALPFLGPQIACRPVTPADVDGGIVVTESLCTYLEGLTGNNTILSICATIEEVGLIASLLSPLFADGHRPEPGCTLLPRSYICATREQLGPAIQAVIANRHARLLFDGGL